MLKTIIFDLDDTLYNYNDLNEQGIKQVCKFTCKRLSLKENHSLPVSHDSALHHNKYHQQPNDE